MGLVATLIATAISESWKKATFIVKRDWHMKRSDIKKLKTFEHTWNLT